MQKRGKSVQSLVLIVLDGWGIWQSREHNAIAQANAPNMSRWWKEASHSTLKAAGEHVGLEPGYMGNSEVGHLHIGAGRLVLQDMMRIFAAIKDKSFFKNQEFLQAMSVPKGNTVHLLGMLSDAGVHSHIDHLFALLELAKRQSVENLCVHVITDGRDTPPRAALKYVEQLEKKLALLNKDWKIASVSGRYFSMDRDKRWNRTRKAYNAMVLGDGQRARSAKAAIEASYKEDKGDEFVEPTLIGDYQPISDGDSIIFYNFRTDRTRQLSHAFVDGEFTHFKRKQVNVRFVCMTEYDPTIKAPVAFPPLKLKNTLGEVVAQHNIHQYRIAETEKFNHVTFFFNGLSSIQFLGEEVARIPSPKRATYDLVPAMSANKIKDFAINVINAGKHEFLLINFANPDMVGHTGNFPATIKAIEVVDRCLGELVQAAQKKGFLVVITADHGNAEEKSEQWKTSHTLNDVPFIVLGKDVKLCDGHLYDVAPTLLKLMGLKRPQEMSGKCLF